MKKFVAVVLSLMLVLSLVCTASAEVRSFVLSGVTDLDGNAIEAEELPMAILTIDDEEVDGIMACVYSTAEADEEGTYVIVEQNDEEGYVIFDATFPEDVIEFVYYAESDACALIDAENNLIYVYLRVAEDATEEAAQ